MADVRDELISMLNKNLELEHAARVQYLAHAEQIKGLNTEKIIERVQEIASDEEKHEQIFRDLIGNYLGGVPTMHMAETHTVNDIGGMLEQNMKQEKHAIEQYRDSYRKIVENKDKLSYTYERLEHDMRHIIMDEEEHVSELALLMGI